MKNLNALLPNTRQVLLALAAAPFIEGFTFVGGSALAVYQNHRLSEDLDFFTWEKNLNINQIQQAIASLEFDRVAYLSISATQINMILDEVKVTFFANNWEKLTEREPLVGNIYIAAQWLLAAMKVNTLFMRAKYRDYYDLYVLNKIFTISEFYQFSTEIMKGLSVGLFQKALIFTDDIQDEAIQHLHPKEKISLKDISKHFEKEIKNWNKKLHSKQ